MTRFSGWLARGAIALAALYLLSATPASAQPSYASPAPPAGYTPISVSECTHVQQPIFLDLSTLTTAASARWRATGTTGQPLILMQSHDPAWSGLPAPYWIRPNPDTGAPGGYVYTTWFVLPCAPSAYTGLKISGKFSADNSGVAVLNNTVIATCAGPACYWTAASFNATAPFHQGVNALSIFVDNPGLVTGAAVSATVTGTCNGYCPNPVLKVCKVAGFGVPVPMNFQFHAAGDVLNVPAGPAPGGSCVIDEHFAFGANVLVKETIPAGYKVSDISVVPSNRVVGSPNLATGAVTVSMGIGVTEVTYTDRRTLTSGFVEICKYANASSSSSATFTLGTPGTYAPVTVHVGSCSPPIEVAIGPLTITEAPGTLAMTACSAIPASRLVACSPANRTMVVNIPFGGPSTQTIAKITNGGYPTTDTGPPKTK